MNYKVADFNYNLPPDLIAQEPSKPRDHSRLLVLNKKNKKIEHSYFYKIINYLRPGDLLVLNNSKVFPARLFAKRAVTGGHLEVFLLRKLKSNEFETKNFKKLSVTNVWECLIRGKVKPGQVMNFSQKLEAKILKNNSDGTRQVKFNFSGDKFWDIIKKIGEVPLPPYIKRSHKKNIDKKNYQTVFANEKKIGSVAAPTAGLHFTKSLLEKIQSKGIKITELTLHVGLGTFLPVKTENINEHQMHSEYLEVNVKTQKEILKTKKAGGRIIAVGTTSCRSLESLNWSKIRKNKIIKQTFWTDIFIYPPYNFKIVDALITNFHLPQSTLLMLVSALAGKEIIDQAYQEAIKEKYNFYSYGDAMFIY